MNHSVVKTVDIDAYQNITKNIQVTEVANLKNCRWENDDAEAFERRWSCAHWCARSSDDRALLGAARPFKIVEAHDEMVKAIQGRPDIQLLTASAHNKHSRAPSGRFDIAIDVRSGDGCGMYRSLMMVKSTGEMHDLATPPLWYQFKDPQDVIAKVYKFLTGMQFFENLDAFADHAINLNEAEASGQIH